ncbi:MAG: neutral/alkaline non-lysosomal ceramidase N-terminal domain-containing protein [Clostridiaceae bacterium]
MKFSVSKVDITPRMPVALVGYGARKGLSQGVHDKLYIRSVLLDDGNCKLLILSIDLLSIKREKANEIKEKITKRYGLPEQNILVHAIHIHSGPGLSIQSIQGCDEKFVVYFDEQVMRCIDMCFESMKPGTLYYGEGETFIGMSRRQHNGGEVLLAPAPDTPIDRKLGVAVIKDEDGKAAAVLFNCACHPAIMGGGNYLISAEFPGAAREMIEKNYPGLTAVFIQGACGDINPAIISKGSEYRETYFSDVEFVGRILANDVNHVIRYGLKKIEPSFNCHIRHLSLPLGEYQVDYFKKMSESDEEYWQKYGRSILDKIEKGEAIKQVDYNLGIIRLAANLKMITLEGEVCNDYGVWIRESASSVHVMIAGYANGHKSYLPTKQILRDGGYEATMTYCWAGYPGPYAEAVQDIVLKAAKEELSYL